MLQKFERIEKHLYRRQYQTAKGEVTMTYYVRFKDGRGKQRKFPLGSQLKTAREDLEEYRVRILPSQGRTTPYLRELHAQGFCR